MREFCGEYRRPSSFGESFVSLCGHKRIMGKNVGGLFGKEVVL